jgi:hypothetical protein
MVGNAMRRRVGMLLFGLMLALGLCVPQAASASNTPPDPAINPGPDQQVTLNCATVGGQINGLWVEWGENLEGQTVLRFQFSTMKKTTATVMYRLHGSYGTWDLAYTHFTPDFATEHIFFTDGLESGAQYDVVIKTYQCGRVVDTQTHQYPT